MADETITEKKSFVVYFDWDEAFEHLDDSELGEIFRALFKYAKEGEKPEFSHKSLNAVFSFMRTTLDRDRKAYEDKCKKNRANGQKGGRPKKPNGFEENPKKPNGYFRKPKKPDNDNDTVIDNENGIDTDNDFFNETVVSKKERFGTFQNVLLTLEEYNLLMTEFPDTYHVLINKFSAGIKANPKYVYADHYAAILLWVENDKNKSKETEKPKSSTSGNVFAEIYSDME